MAQSVKSLSGLAIASVKSVESIAIASVKSIMGLDNTSAGGGTWTFGASAGGTGTGLTATVILTGVTAGDTIVIGMKFEGGAGTTSSAADLSSTFQALTAVNHSNSDLTGRLFYLLSSVATGTVTYTVTLGAVRAGIELVVARWSHSGGTPAFDAECTGGGGTNNSATTHTSGATLTTTGTADLFFGFYTDYSGEAIGSTQINAVASSSSGAQGNTRLWWRNNVAATVTNAAATGTTGSPATSCVCCMALKL